MTLPAKNTAEASPGALRRFIDALEAGLDAGRFVKLTVAAPSGIDGAERVTVRRISLRGATQLSFVTRHASRDVTVNATLHDGGRRAVALLEAGCRAAHLQLADAAFEKVLAALKA